MVIIMVNSTRIYQQKSFNVKYNTIKFSSEIINKVVLFNNKVFEEFKSLEENGVFVNDNYYEYITELNQKVFDSLSINNYNDFNKALGAIKSSELLVDNAIANNDLEALTEGLYGLGFLLEDLNLFGR